ncbi:hypothetical protein D9757_011330 [Collybiopsis confluens]|uniref:Uncharacterized protein n=1 Tax=Collybiopsis confluens TaxID=2823264 RepID=A0A8H5LPC5_9AGAR|nr:hypothetical protein D9757_011330 [Collybiopsis confluens]
MSNIASPQPAALKAPMTAQPQAAQNMSVTNAPSTRSCQDVEHGACKHHKHAKGGLVARLRGGGVGKDCFLGLIGCCLCLECCEGKVAAIVSETSFAALAKCAAKQLKSKKLSVENSRLACNWDIWKPSATNYMD